MSQSPTATFAAQRRVWGTVAVVSTAIISLSTFAAPDRAWASGYLMAYYLLTLGLGGAVFVALANATGAGWHVAFRRVPEAMCRLVPAGGLLVLVLLAAQSQRFEWHAHGNGAATPFWFKELWLSPLFLGMRGVLYLVVWMAFSHRLVSLSRGQDRLPTTAAQRAGTFESALFLALFAVTFSLASVDWVMALEPLWFSTMWGVYHFSGLFQATLAAIIIASILLRRHGSLAGLFREEHLHDLGKLLLGFSCFWMYIWFSQYMLIWYSNIPEETIYFTKRLHGDWGPMIVASLVLNWGIPFLLLLPRENKRHEQTMLRIAAVVLIGRWIDLSVMIYPPVIGDAPALGVPEVAGLCAGLSLAVYLFLTAFPRSGPVPVNDPFLEESLHYSN